MDDIFIEKPKQEDEVPTVDLEYTKPDLYDAVYQKVTDRSHVSHLKTKMRKRKKSPVTRREGDVLYVIRMYQLKMHLTPTLVDIARILQIHKNHVGRLVRSLCNKGYISIHENPDNPLRNTIKFPEGIIFPFWDDSQFPAEVFNPTKMKHINEHLLQKFYDSNSR